MIAKVDLLGFRFGRVHSRSHRLFLAGSFCGTMEILRTLPLTNAIRSKGVFAFGRAAKARVPVTLLGGLVVSLAFFFLQKDLGPAWSLTCLFLALILHRPQPDALIAAAGLSVSAGWVPWADILVRVPHTVYERASPCGRRLGTTSSTAAINWPDRYGRMPPAGIRGTGPGLGDPALVPAAHTDLILSALGEEWGFLGVAAVFAVYAFILYRSARIALRARSDYEFFLAAGLGVAMALQILLIAGGYCSI